MDLITTFFGRFHPLLVHLPIGILFLAFLFECLSFRRGYKSLKKAVQPALLWGAISAMAAAITGFFLRQEGGYDQIIADRHQNFGILTPVLAVVVYVLRPKVKYWVDSPKRRKQVKLALSAPLILCLILTGHWGGSLTHGEDYLFATVSNVAVKEKDPAEAMLTISDVGQAVLYNDVIQPIFEARCYDCHSSSKQKGDLRLDGVEFIIRGGKNGLLIGNGPADSSALFRRLTLPIEDDDHMPPREKPQLSSSEIALLKYWIEGNASFEKTVAEFEKHEKIAAVIRSMQQPPEKSWLPRGEVIEAEVETLNQLRAVGVNPIPLAEANKYLTVNFIGKQHLTNDLVNSLQQIQEQLVWLNLGHSGITDEQLEAIGQLRNLRVLYLNNTAITDEGITKLSSLTELRWLSVVGTRVSDASAAALSNMTNLTSLYLFQTDVTKDGILKMLEANQEIRIDTGNYTLKNQLTN